MKRPDISFEVVMVSVIAIVIIGMVTWFSIEGKKAYDQWHSEWEHVSGDLYRRADCDARVFIYREVGGFGQVALSHSLMDDAQFARFCGEPR